LENLDQELQIHPFLQPQRNIWIWIWGIAQVGFAGLVCWFLLDLANEATPNTWNEALLMWFKAVLVGIGFNAVLNADEATDFLGLNLGAIYKSVTKPIALQIHATQPRTDRFWFELQKHLAALKLDQIDNGMKLLREKFNNSKKISPEQRQELLIAVQQIRDATIPISERPEAILELLKYSVPRRSLPEILAVLGCEDSFVKRHVPKRSQKLFLSNNL
jgi:hypothetical protein